MLVYISLLAGLLVVLGVTAWLGRGRRRVAVAMASLLLLAILGFIGQGDRALVHDPLVDEPRFWSLEVLDERYGGAAVLVERR